jgi:Mrp family chromosome partitioning ATPase/capsular polysaccharide biosynthesis protein
MDLLTYVRALRRRWLLVVACVVLGALIGYGTTLLDRDEPSAKDGRTYYKATTTVLVDTSSSGDGILQPAFTNLDQIALLATTGDVPAQVADEVGFPEGGRVLGERVVTTTNTLTNTLEIAVVDSDRERAPKLADAIAAEIDTAVQAEDQERFETAIDDLNQKIAALQQQADDLRARVQAVPPPPDIESLRRQYEATQFNYYSRFSQLQELSSAGPASTSLTVLESAEAEPISASEYAARLSLGASGDNHIRTGVGEADASELVTGTSSSSFNSPIGRGFAGGFIGLLVGVGIALFVERLDRRMRTREEVEHAFQLPVLAEVPRLARKDLADDSLVAFSAPLSRVAEAFRAVRTSLVFQQSMAVEGASANGDASGGNGRRATNGTAGAAGDHHDVDEPLVVMVTSASPREGKTTTSANLAVAFAEGGASVLVVNCDFRRPTIHRRFRVFDEPRRVQDTPVPGVKIVTNVLADPAANPSQVVAAQRQVVAAARGRFDVIILDTAPMLTANDAVGILSAVDLVLLVAKLDMSTADSARRVMEVLERVHAMVSGVVLIGASDASNEYYYYYQRERLPAPPSEAEPAPPDERRRGAPEPVPGDRPAPSDIFDSEPDSPATP